MAQLTLGLDIGPTSLGWCLIDLQSGRIVACGVRIFPEGVDRDQKGTELSKNANRRLSRAARRQIARRARRKREVRKLLVEAGLLPKVALLPRTDAARGEWERDAFDAADPYQLRKRGLDEKLELHEFGRALLHLNQRRGFLSNHKTDRGQKKETEGLLGEITQLKADIQAAGKRTLGEHLADLPETERLRGHHTSRQMYLDEFEALWTVQQTHHPKMLTEKFKVSLHRAMFFQRPLLPPSPSAVGRCELIPRLARCPRADRRAQRLRLYQEVNNLRVMDDVRLMDRPLTPDEREKALALLTTKKEATFDELRKKLFKGRPDVRFNLERGERTKLHGMPIDAALADKKRRLGAAYWEVLEEQKDRIVAAIIDDDEAWLRSLLTENGFDAELAAELLESTPLEEGYSSYSLHAIKRLLPHVEQGQPLTSRDETVPSAYRSAGFLAPWERPIDGKTELPQPPELTNPIVRAALHEVRKVVNAILREFIAGGEHQLKLIRIELAREARGTAKDRAERISEMRKNERRRAEARQRLEELSIKPTRGSIDRWLLWKDQKEQCIYSGEPISEAQLFGGEVDIDHILPYPRTNDDSQSNKVVCFKRENSKGVSTKAKGDQTPYEWLAKTDPEKYEQVRQRARILSWSKRKRFLMEELDTDFSKRQLVDTTYITTQVRDYLKQLGAEIECLRGQHTADLRHRWGLDTVLMELKDSPAWKAAADLPTGHKNRLDHRHHAVDAIVIALTDRSRLQHLARVFEQENIERLLGRKRVTPELAQATRKLLDPWEGFRSEVSEAVAGIHVSYRVQRRVSGAFHEDTIYGATENAGEVVVRKPLTALTTSMVAGIRDPIVRKKVEDRLKEFGVSAGRKKKGDAEVKIPKEAWSKPLWMNEEKQIPINTVRVVKTEASVAPIRGGTALVKPGNTHHIEFFEASGGKGKKALVARFVTLLEAARRVRAHEPVIAHAHPDDPKAEFLFSLGRNELVLMDYDGREVPFRFVTAASTTGQMYFKHHCAGGKAGDAIGQVSKKPGTLVCRKITVDPIGRIRWAND